MWWMTGLGDGWVTSKTFCNCDSCLRTRSYSERNLHFLLAYVLPSCSRGVENVRKDTTLLEKTPL